MKNLHQLALPDDIQLKLKRAAAMHQMGRGPVLQVLAVASPGNGPRHALIGAGRRPDTPLDDEGLLDRARRTVEGALGEHVPDDLVFHYAVFDTEAKKLKHVYHDRRFVWRVDTDRPNSPDFPYMLEVVDVPDVDRPEVYSHFAIDGHEYAFVPAAGIVELPRFEQAALWLQSQVIRGLAPRPEPTSVLGQYE
ncbi:MAG: hypothetical protein AAGN64_04035 [Bacteroidota bacterium]